MTRAWPRVDGGLGSTLGFTIGTAVTIASIASGATGHPSHGLIALATTVVGISAITTLTGSLVTAILCWWLYAGFLLGHAGHPLVDARSLRAAAVLAVTALLATAIGALIRSGSLRTDRPPEHHTARIPHQRIRPCVTAPTRPLGSHPSGRSGVAEIRWSHGRRGGWGGSETPPRHR